MTCLRTAFHGGTKLLTILEFSFRVRTLSEFKIEFEDVSSATLCLANPGSSVAVRDKNNVVEYLG